MFNFEPVMTVIVEGVVGATLKSSGIFSGVWGIDISHHLERPCAIPMSGVVYNLRGSGTLLDIFEKGLDFRPWIQGHVVEMCMERRETRILAKGVANMTFFPVCKEEVARIIVDSKRGPECQVFALEDNRIWDAGGSTRIIVPSTCGPKELEKFKKLAEEEDL